MISYKNVPGKKSYYKRKCMGTKNVYNYAKKGLLIFKTPMAIFKIQMQKKVFFYGNILDLPSFSQELGLFSRVFFSSDIFSLGLYSCDLISWDFIVRPHTILGKKIPRNPKHRTLFPMTFFSKNLRNFRLFF